MTLLLTDLERQQPLQSWHPKHTLLQSRYRQFQLQAPQQCDLTCTQMLFSKEYNLICDKKEEKVNTVSH